MLGQRICIALENQALLQRICIALENQAQLWSINREKWDMRPLPFRLSSKKIIAPISLLSIYSKYYSFFYFKHSLLKVFIIAHCFR
jgi:hypothetical protein